MGILEWFKSRPAQFDPDRVSDELVRWAVEKAITLTNPRLKLLSNCRKRLTPAVGTTIGFLRAQARALPPVQRVSSTVCSSGPALRAFFVAPSDLPVVLGRSDNLRTLFDKAPELDEAYLVLGMAFNEQRVFGMALHGDMVQGDVLNETSTDLAADADFAVAELNGSPPMRRAFMLARVARTELPPPQKINFDDVTGYL